MILNRVARYVPQWNLLKWKARHSQEPSRRVKIKVSGEKKQLVNTRMPNESAWSTARKCLEENKKEFDVRQGK